MEFHTLKNKEVLDCIEYIDNENILEIHYIQEPTYNLKNLMMAVMLLLDMPQDWKRVIVETYYTSAFI